MSNASLEICRVCNERPATHIALRGQGTVSFPCCDTCDTKREFVPVTIKRGDRGWIGGFQCVVISAEDREARGGFVIVPL